MKKRIFAVLLAVLCAAVCVVSFCACGGKTKTPEIYLDGSPYGGVYKKTTYQLQYHTRLWHFKYTGQERYFDIYLYYKGEQIPAKSYAITMSAYSARGEGSYNIHLPTEPGLYTYSVAVSGVVENNKLKYRPVDVTIYVVVEE